MERDGREVSRGILPPTIYSTFTTSFLPVVVHESKWKDMIETGIPEVGLQEGAGYQSKGVWRACLDCRMRTNDATGFCPVCQRAIYKI